MKAMSNCFVHCRPCSLRQEKECGFTLIELMVTMVMGLIILAGITALFISYSKTSTVVSSRTERMGDLYLATQMMQADLRVSAAIAGPVTQPADLTSRGVSLPGGYPATFTSGLPYWDATTKTLTYQDQDGNTGIFQYQRTSNDRIYWLRPDPSFSTFQELIRDLDTSNGMCVGEPCSTGVGSSAALNVGIITIKLNAAYADEERKNKNLTISFKTWPRN
jgi:prepilin-type N-terminal cleavage/methylation domain-containing protein